MRAGMDDAPDDRRMVAVGHSTPDGWRVETEPGFVPEKIWNDSRIFGILWPAEEFEGCHAVAEAEDVLMMRNEYENKLAELRAEIGRLAMLVVIHFPEAVSP